VTRYCYILTEGAQDVALLIKILSREGIKQIQKRSQVDSFWDELIPKTFPFNDELNKQVPVPKFLQSNDLSIAIQSAIGDTRLIGTLEEDFTLIAKEDLVGIGIILDADNCEAQTRFDKIRSEIYKRSLGVEIPSKCGIVSQAANRVGIFVLPDNRSTGTLENILIECGESNYPDLIEKSREYIKVIDHSKLKGDDLKELNKPAGENKAIVGIASNILKPGRTLQVSLQDNRWIDDTTINLPKIKALREFLMEVLGINYSNNK
jgi:hypothetical protein